MNSGNGGLHFCCWSPQGPRVWQVQFSSDCVCAFLVFVSSRVSCGARRELALVAPTNRGARSPRCHFLTLLRKQDRQAGRARPHAPVFDAPPPSTTSPHLHSLIFFASVRRHAPPSRRLEMHINDERRVVARHRHRRHELGARGLIGLVKVRRAHVREALRRGLWGDEDVVDDFAVVLAHLPSLEKAVEGQ